MKQPINTWIQALESTGLDPTLASGLSGEAQLGEMLQMEARKAATVSILNQLWILPDKQMIVRNPKMKLVGSKISIGILIVWCASSPKCSLANVDWNDEYLIDFFFARFETVSFLSISGNPVFL